ncbi:MAG: methionyl-tRNA formyltransferase [Gomphosphaeria aponina SAG 52.96 = DSM 107014]|uniref:Methionyl-tRNA formyltransferase n=1 Tax=Gomphosphaeria aponina SAG 52.96 = DSM 107014 TaxID=1521640 RepID=A0A941GUZ9_9CHRO|nr:methionyl-tRNA formyltransferase [Gomphosphaeria aponina SAG 52.96 = DSM 107014]
MQVIFFGTPQFAVPSLERLLENPHFEVIAVVTQPDKVRGRGNKIIPAAVKQVALEHNLPVWQPKRIKKDTATLNQLKQAKADAFVVVAYGQILSKEILAMPKLGCINVHGSILPKYRGAAPIQWSIYHGEKETGVTTMLMDEGMDTGAILLKTKRAIALFDNAHSIATNLASSGADLLIETLLKLEKQEIQPIPQDDSAATYAPLIQKADYALNWHRTAIELHNQIRAFYPDCVASLRGKPLKILATAPCQAAYASQLPPELQQLDISSPTGNPGEIVSNLKKSGPIIQTGEGLLLLLEVQLAGKRPQSGWDFVNGMRLSQGELLDNG